MESVQLQLDSEQFVVLLSTAVNVSISLVHRLNTYSRCSERNVHRSEKAEVRENVVKTSVKEQRSRGSELCKEWGQNVPG